MFSMRRSRVIEKLQSGEIVYSFKHNINDPRVVEIASMAGFDCVWVCMEHIPLDGSILEAQVYAARAWDTDIMVRVPRGSYSDYIRPLEMNATGIMVPHVMSLEDARNVVRMTRFHPIGRRPLDGGNSDGAYGSMPVDEYVRQANEQRFVALQIEDPEPMQELDAICALDGIDIVFFGPGDYSHSIGVPGQMDDPRIADARKRIAEAANRQGKVAGTVATLDNVAELIDMGYRFLNVGADVIALSRHCLDAAQQLGLKPRQPARTE